MDSTVKPISAAPFSAACKRLHALFQVARDVLDHHDGIVHHETGGDRQRHQRQVVEAVVQQVHHAERADQRDGHRHAGNEGTSAGLRRNANTTRITRNTEINSVRSTSCTEARMVTV